MNQQRTERPHVFVTRERVAGLRAVDELAEVIAHPHGAVIWGELLKVAEAAIGAPPVTPTDALPGREPGQVRAANRDYSICHAAGQRVLCCALAHLVTQKRGYRDAALQQIACLFDERVWLEWRDHAHRQLIADLRTGMLSEVVALAYDWLYESMSPADRSSVLEGLTRCGIDRYLRGYEAGEWWVQPINNWHLVMVGGLGIAGMALAEDHPQAQRLVDLATPSMTAYLEQIGPEGESNESPSYAGAIAKLVAFFTALRYHQRSGRATAADEVVAKNLHWILQMTIPPGVVAPIGDGHVGARPQAPAFAAIADATGDGVLQQFYLTHSRQSARARQYPMELLWFNPRIEPTSAKGRLPLGRAYKAHSGCIVSRASWEDESTSTVVLSKAGHGFEGHGHHDAGQVCIDGYGRRLLVDLGVYSYPADFFGPNRWQYYFASSRGHNLLTVAGREMKSSERDVARIVASEFDDARGGWWQLDLTPLHEGVKKMARTVVHLLPHVAVVLDEVELEQAQTMTLRWHTADRAEPTSDGRATVVNEGVSLALQVAALDGAQVRMSRGEHEHRAPFDRSRMGDPLEQKRESYIDAQVTGERCQLLTLMCVFGPGQQVNAWQGEGGAWRIDSSEGAVVVDASAGEGLRVQRGGVAWACPVLAAR